MRAHWLWLAGLAALGAALAGCGGGEEAPPPSTPATAPTTPAVTPAPTQTTTPAPTPTPTPTPVPGTVSLTTIATGNAGEILLEWSGGPAGVKRWQYRRDDGRERDYTWQAWTDIPNSTATTTSYLVSGLVSYRGYLFEVRPVLTNGPGTASSTEPGVTPRIRADGIPETYPLQIVNGGRTWRLSESDVLADIPAGMRVIVPDWIYVRGSDGTYFTVAMVDVETMSYFELKGNGQVVGRQITPAATASSRTRDVNALFDQIIASIRLVPRPPEPTPTPTPAPAVEMPAFEPVGEGTYKVSRDGVIYVVFDIPPGIRIEWDGIGSDSSGTIWFTLREVTTRSWLSIDAMTGKRFAGDIREATDSSGLTATEVAALFKEIERSLRVVVEPHQAAMPTPTPTPLPPTPVCTQATLGVDPATNAGLAGDCDTLLAIKAALAGTGSLNWSASTVLTSWDGVTVSGTPKRVTSLSLSSQGLTGTVPPALGNLREVKVLRLNGNQLTGKIPSKLGQLTVLTDVQIQANQLTGCVPSAWKTAPTKNLGGLPYCPPPLDAWDHDTLIGGNTYKFQPNSRTKPLIIDIPEGWTFTWDAEEPDSAGGPASLLIIDDTTSESDIIFNWYTGEEYLRSESSPPISSQESGGKSVSDVLDEIAESVWISDLK